MTPERACAWMTGPRGSALRVPAVQWWLAVSRGVLARDARRTSTCRPPVTCSHTPAFNSPMTKRTP